MGHSATTVVSAEAADRRSLWAQFVASPGPRLREQLIASYLSFTRNLAVRSYRMRGDNSVPFDDYLQYARVGLLEAIDRYDPGREASFETFASYRIRGAILNGLGHETELAAQRDFWRTHTAERIESLECHSPASGSGDEAELGELVQLTMGLAIGFLLESGESALIDETPAANPYAATELAQLSERVREAVSQLPEREQGIIRRHYFSQYEFQAIARELSLSKGRVSQLHAQALGRLRGMLRQVPELDRSL
jgi:RNA polymerase sigma factor for flagellar operon FliA